MVQNGSAEYDKSLGIAAEYGAARMYAGESAWARVDLMSIWLNGGSRGRE